jgi:hypothetical protein
MAKDYVARLAAFEKWAETVDPADLKPQWAPDLAPIAKLRAERDVLDAQLRKAVAKARKGGRGWTEIGYALGVSKQAAHQKYGGKNSAA